LWHNDGSTTQVGRLAGPLLRHQDPPGGSCRFLHTRRHDSIPQCLVALRKNSPRGDLPFTSPLREAASRACLVRSALATVSCLLRLGTFLQHLHPVTTWTEHSSRLLALCLQTQCSVPLGAQCLASKSTTLEEEARTAHGQP